MNKSILQIPDKLTCVDSEQFSKLTSFFIDMCVQRSVYVENKILIGGGKGIDHNFFLNGT